MGRIAQEMGLPPNPESDARTAVMEDTPEWYSKLVHPPRERTSLKVAIHQFARAVDQ